MVSFSDVPGAVEYVVTVSSVYDPTDNLTVRTQTSSTEVGNSCNRVYNQTRRFLLSCFATVLLTRCATSGANRAIVPFPEQKQGKHQESFFETSNIEDLFSKVGPLE